MPAGVLPYNECPVYPLGTLQQGGRRDMSPHFKIKGDLLCIPWNPPPLLTQHLL